MMTATTRRACRILALACLLASGAVSAEVAGDELDLLAQENLVYSAARYAQTIAETPANVSIISRDDMRRYGYRSVHDALKSLPGVYDAASQWPALGVSGIAVPGDFGSRVLYMVNGMPIYEPTYGGFFLDYLDIDSIERIEFVKGPGSALYGSGAVMGVVNLITRSGQDSVRNRLGLNLDSHHGARLYGSHNQQYGRVHTFVTASANTSHGRELYLPEFDAPGFGQARYHGVAKDNDRARTARLFARVATDNAWAQALVVGGSKRDPLASYGSVFNARLSLRESMAALEAGYTVDFGQAGQLTTRAYLFQTEERGDYPYARSARRGVAPQYINVSDLSSHQQGVEVRYDRFFAPGHHVLVGAEAKRIGYAHQVGDQPALERRGVFSVDRRDSYSQWAVFAQDEMRAGPGKLFLGARFDSYHGFSRGVSSRLSPRLAYVQDLAGGVTAKLVYGEAYRAPTVYESRYQDGEPAASTIWANGELRPERSQSLEALLIGQAANGVQWRISTFLKHLHDTPVQVLTPRYNNINCGLSACIQYRNSGQIQRVAGGEFDVRLRQGDQGDLYASLVLQRGHDDDGELTSMPRQQIKLGMSRALPWQGADAALEAQYISPVSGRNDLRNALRERLPAYLVTDLVLNVARVPRGWRMSARVDNLFDRAYGTVASRELQPLRSVPADGRRYSLQLQRDF